MMSPLCFFPSIHQAIVMDFLQYEVKTLNVASLSLFTTRWCVTLMDRSAECSLAPPAGVWGRRSCLGDLKIVQDCLKLFKVQWSNTYDRAMFSVTENVCYFVVCVRAHWLYVNPVMLLCNKICRTSVAACFASCVGRSWPRRGENRSASQLVACRSIVH